MNKTVYTGDIIQGVPVISSLNTADLEVGKIYRFMFVGGEMNIGQNWYVPLMVARGVHKGKQFLLNAGIHGDEINGVAVIQQIFAAIDVTKLHGTIIGVLQASPNSLFHVSKNWYLSSDGGDYENMNRAFPGTEFGSTTQRHAWKLWNLLWRGNVDYMIDLHSQSTDTEYPLFVFADYRNEIAKQMAELIPADQIKDDEGEQGTVETSFIQHNIPAITIELGAARIFQNEYIARSIVGVYNILRHLGFIQTPIAETALTNGCFIANEMTSIRAKTGGYARVLVAIGEDVVVEQLVAQQFNPFGDIIASYNSPVAGKVLSIGTGATREPGGLLVRVLYQK